MPESGSGNEIDDFLIGIEDSGIGEQSTRVSDSEGNGGTDGSNDKPRRRRRRRNANGELVERSESTEATNVLLTKKPRTKGDKNLGLTAQDIGVSLAVVCQLVVMATGDEWWNLQADDISERIGKPLVVLSNNASPTTVKALKGIANAAPLLAVIGGAIALFAQPIALSIEKHGNTKQPNKNKNRSTRYEQQEPVRPSSSSSDSEGPTSRIPIEQEFGTIVGSVGDLAYSPE